jgi:hypothetical protein
VVYQVTRRTALYAVMAMAGLVTVKGAVSAQQVDKARVDIQTMFTPSGWMGDGEYGRKYIDFTGTDRTEPQSPPDSIRITYTFGPKTWGGICWQNQPDNWGDMAGSDYSGKGFSNVAFWAKGALGGEVVEFKVGGTANPQKQHGDSLSVTSGRVTLGKKWERYSVDVAKANLSSVINGFCWVASSDYNRAEKVTFYLDDLVLE